MTTKIQDVGFQLMKSPRELASWDFPLSKILEEYSKLLPETENIHYGEVALVIQNSVNAYVRRLEELYDETKLFTIKLLNRQGNNEGTSILEGKKEQKNYINCLPFQLLDLEKETRKSVNLKRQNRKTVNFLHGCFSQLESSNGSLCINLYDIQDELIGKKYDFRCNQRISKYGSLVDEFNLDDFDDHYVLIKNCLITETNNNSRLNNSSINSKSCVISDNNVDFNRYDSFPSSRSTFSDYYIHTPEGKNKIIKFTSVPDSNQCSFKVDSNILKSSPSSCYTDNDPETFSSTIRDSKRNDDSMNLKNCESNKGRERNNTSKRNDVNFGTNFLIYINNLQNENVEKQYLVERNIVAMQKMENPIIAGFKPLHILRRSKRIKEKNNYESSFLLNDANKLQPISFTSGIPEKADKNRTKFRFPCNRKLLSGCLNFRKKKYYPIKKYCTEIKSIDDNLNYTDNTGVVIKLRNNIRGSSKDFPSLLNTENILPSTLPLLDLCQSLESNNNNNNNNNNQLNIYKRCKSGMETIIKEKIKSIYKELGILTDADKKIAKWHEEIKPKLIEAERKPPFFIHEYESRIVEKLEKSNRRLEFNEIIREESFCEIARFFSATLQLASTNNLNINPSRDTFKGIELVLLD